MEESHQTENLVLDQPSEETILKRRYLSVEIIQSGYNPDEFAEYISGLKEDGNRIIT